ncbi:MAG: hypothetical protein IT422_04925 [Pirellulaceae bacterium]|nr:hypothetical protein [Pirellulaceae bacterium]
MMHDEDGNRVADSMSTIEHLLRNVPEGNETVFDLLDQGGASVKTIEVKRRKLQPEPPIPPVEAELARAQARSHIFNDIGTFAGYLKREASPSGATILADVSSRLITAVLDENDDTDNEQVTMRAIEHPLFSPWGSLLERAVGVIEFSLFCMKYRRAIIEPEGRELALTFSQVKMSKAVSVHSGVGKKSLNGVLVDIEIAGERKGMVVELPETIIIDVPLFVGSPSQRIEIDLLVTNKGDDVVVYCTAADVEAQRIFAFEQMVSDLAVATGMLVGLGSISHRGWNTVR